MGGLLGGGGQQEWAPGQMGAATGSAIPFESQIMGGSGGPWDQMFGLGGELPMGGMPNALLSGGNTPQQRGYGIQTPQPFEQYSPGGGLLWSSQDPYGEQRGAAGANGMTQAPTGWDFTGPGVGEQWQQQNQSRFLEPTNAQEQFDKTNISQNLDPYYNNAIRRANEATNSAFGARGLFNSSAALGQNAENITNLEAEKANREGAFELQRAGLLGNLAQGADQQNLSNLGMGFSAAQGAEQARRQRGRDYISDIMGSSFPVAAMAGNTYNQMIQGDLDLMNQAMMAEMGLAGTAENQAANKKQEFWSDTKNTAGLLGNVMGGMMGGK